MDDLRPDEFAQDDDDDDEVVIPEMVVVNFDEEVNGVVGGIDDVAFDVEEIPDLVVNEVDEVDDDDNDDAGPGIDIDDDVFEAHDEGDDDKLDDDDLGGERVIDSTVAVASDSLSDKRMAFRRSSSSFLCIVLRFVTLGGHKKSL